MVYGVVAEFNPFHNGHKYQLDMINKLNPSIKIALISGSYVQRGELSILSLADKVKIALDMGYDVVAQIPDIYSIQNAEIYCSFSTRILEELGADFQVFGAETDKVEDIYKLIELVDSIDIKEYLEKGYSYNKSISLALADMSKLYTSNNILAMEYLKAIRKYGLNIRPVIIKRQHTGYNDENIVKEFASASKIRQLIANNEDFKHLLPYNHEPKYIYNYEDKMFSLFKYIFLTRNNKNIYDMSVDIHNVIKNKLRISNNYTDFITNISKRNISISRIKRLILNTLLNIQKEDIQKDEEIKNIKILGINEKGAKYIKNIKKACVDYSKYEYDKKEFLILKDYLIGDEKFKKLIYRK